MCSAIRQTDGRHTGGEAQRRISMPYLYCPSKGWMSERVQGRRSIPFVVHDAGTDRRETGIITGAPPVSTPCLPDIIAHDQISQAFPHHICILQVIKYWQWECLGTRLLITVLMILQ